MRRLSRFVSGWGSSWGRVLGVRRLLPLLDLLHWRPLAHRLLLLVRPTVDTTGTVKTWPSSRATAFYWVLRYWLLLLRSLYCGTTSPNHQSPPQAAGPGLPHCWLFPLWTEPEQCDEVLTFYNDQNQKEQEEKCSQKVLQRSTSSFCCVLAGNNQLNICFHQPDHDQ